MKKMFTIGFFLLIQYACTAGEEEDQFTRLSKTHKIEVRPETAETIFYPETYKNYQEFKELYLEAKYVTELLAERLKILCDFRELSGQSSEKKSGKYIYYKDCLDRNQIALVSNAKQGALDSIKFSETYNNPLTNHIIKVASLLQDRLLKESLPTEDKSTREKLANLIKKFESWQKEEGCGSALGSTSSQKHGNAASATANKTDCDNLSEAAMQKKTAKDQKHIEEEEDQQKSKASQVEERPKREGLMDIWGTGIDECIKGYELYRDPKSTSEQLSVIFDNIERYSLEIKLCAYRAAEEAETAKREREVDFEIIEAAMEFLGEYIHVQRGALKSSWRQKTMHMWEYTGAHVQRKREMRLMRSMEKFRTRTIELEEDRPIADASGGVSALLHAAQALPLPGPPALEERRMQNTHLLVLGWGMKLYERVYRQPHPRTTEISALLKSD